MVAKEELTGFLDDVTDTCEDIGEESSEYCRGSIPHSEFTHLRMELLENLCALRCVLSLVSSD